MTVKLSRAKATKKKTGFNMFKCQVIYICLKLFDLKCFDN